ncbi:hypothetical protein LBMAG42_56010 [Deltaproteobacteria bacterium]|nr:hypothetical protein LBMAG42_56010 [Deltaproteobacteria bacterium]
MVLRQVVVALVVAVVIGRQASALAAAPGMETEIHAMAEALPRLLSAWAVAMCLPSLVLARASLLRPGVQSVVNAWTLLAGVHLALQGTLSCSASAIQSLVIAHVLATGCGVFGLLFGMRSAARPPGVDLGYWRPLALAAVCVTLLGAWGEGPGGTRINLVVGDFTLQLLEALPFLITVSTVLLWSASEQRVARGWHWVGWGALVTGLLALVVFRLDDRGAALVVLVALGLIAVWMMDLGAVVPVPVVAVMVAIAAGVTVHEAAGHADNLLLLRLLMRSDPFENGLAGAEQLAKAILAVEHGGWFGVAPGVFDVNDVPAAANDMAVPVFSGVFGAVPTLVWLGLQLRLVGLLVHAGGRDVQRWTGPRRAAGAIGVTLAAKLLCNVLGALGVLPLTGLCAPLLSAGDSALVVTFGAIGYACGVIAPELRGATVNARVSATRLWSLTSAFALPAAAMLVVYATAGARGAGHRFYVTTDADGVVRAHPPADLSRMAARIARPTLLARDGELLAVTTPFGSRIRVGPPSVAEAVGQPGDVAGTLESGVGSPFPMICPEPREGRELPCARDLSSLTPLLYLSPEAIGAQLAAGPEPVQTSIDRGLSLALAPIIEARVDLLPAAVAGILVLRDEGGHILAEVVARRPGVFGRRWSDATNLAPMIHAPPGSQLKAAVVAAADEDGVPRDTLLPCVKKAGRGRIRVCGPRGCSIIRDFPRGVHEQTLTIGDVIERSCNAGTIGLALMTDGTRIASLIGHIGDTEPPDLSDPQVLAEASIGQGTVSLSAEDMSAGMLALTTDGVLRRCELTDGQAACPTVPLVGQSAAEWTRSLLLRVVEGEHGTARAARLPAGLHAALKSGTAQDPARDDDPQGGDDAWLSGIVDDDSGHTVAITLFFPHAEVTGGTLASLVPAIAEALVAEGYLIPSITTEATLTEVVSL